MQNCKPEAASNLNGFETQTDVRIFCSYNSSSIVHILFPLLKIWVDWALILVAVITGIRLTDRSRKTWRREDGKMQTFEHVMC